MKKPVGSIKTSWPADHVERRSVESLIPYAKNSRTHSNAQIDKLIASIKQWGWTTPVLIDENGRIIAGHGRVMAAQKLGLENVPCVIARGWTDEMKKAYVIGDNRIAEMAGWDMSSLISEAQALMDAKFDIDLAGIDEIFLGASLNEYQPILEPNVSHREITDADVDKTKGKLDTAYDKAAVQKLIEVICPHCGEEFEVSGE